MNECKHDWYILESYQSKYEPSLTHETQCCRKCQLLRHITKESEKADVVPIK